MKTAEPLPKRITQDPVAVIDLEEETLRILDIYTMTAEEIEEAREKTIVMISEKRGWVVPKPTVQ